MGVQTNDEGDCVIREPAKVALVFPGAVDGVGGAEVQALHYLTSCDQNVIDARLVLLGHNPTFEERAASLEFDKVDVLNHCARHPWHPAVVREYVAYLKHGRFDLVHLYGLRQEVVTRPASKYAGDVKVISAIRGMESHRRRQHTVLNQVTTRWVDLWISNSEETRMLFCKRDGLPLDRIKVVPNGVALPVREDLARLRHETRGELGIGSEDRVVICVANHFPEKRISDLIAAMSIVDAGMRHCVLIVAGRFTEHTRELESMAVHSECRVMLLGYRSDVPRLLAASDVMALVSEKEGMPSSVLEGMAAGLPAVVTPVASLTNLIRDGENGYVVPVGDVCALAERLEVLCRNDEEASSFGDRARRIVAEEFSITKMTNRINDIYLALIRGTLT